MISRTVNIDVYCGICFMIFTGISVSQEHLSCGSLRVSPEVPYEGDTVTFVFNLLIEDRRNAVRLWKNRVTQVYPNNNNKIVQISDNTHIDFILPNATLSDSGQYQSDCGTDYAATNQVWLKVTAQPNIGVSFKESRNITDLGCNNCLLGWEGSNMNIECLISGKSKLEQQEFNVFIKRSVDKNRLIDPSTFNILNERLLQATEGFKPTTEDNGKTVTCLVLYSRLNKTFSNEVTLRILRKSAVPDPTVAGTVKENMSVSIKCSSPKDITTSIRKIKYNDTEYMGHWTDTETTQTLQFSRYDNGRPLQCCLLYRSFEKHRPKSTDKLCGKGNKLDVKYTASIVSLRNGILNADDDGNVNLVLYCSTSESNPKSDISWTNYQDFPHNEHIEDKERKDTTYGWTVTKKLTANITRLHHGKIITCVVTNTEFPEWKQTREYHINITYRPYITISRVDQTNTISAYVGDVIVISCAADANPIATIQWFSNSSKIADGRWLKLNADGSIKPGYYNYTCSASNGVGPRYVNQTVTLHIKAGSERPATTMASTTAKGQLIPVVIAVVCGIVVIVAGVSITVYCLKRRRRMKENAHELTTPNISRTDGKTEHRTLGPDNDNLPRMENTEPNTASTSDAAEYASIVPKHQRKSVARQPYLQTTTNEGNISKGGSAQSAVPPVCEEEQQEYSSVVPRDQRSSSVQQNRVTESPTMIYADLDLSDGNASFRIAKEEEATTYVSIDSSAMQNNHQA